MDINAQLLNRILEQIKIKQITEKDCLKECNINTSFLSDWKHGKIKSPAFDKVYRIIRFLNISLDNLSTNINNMVSYNTNQQELLDLYAQLDPIKQAEFKGEIRGYIRAEKKRKPKKILEEMSVEELQKVANEKYAQADMIANLIEKKQEEESPTLEENVNYLKNA